MSVVFLFDLDGVILDTEQAYESVWQKLADTYGITDPLFTKRIKGTHIRHILETYFTHLSGDQQQEMLSVLRAEEQKMTYQTIPGVLSVLRELKEHEMRVGLVTSSENAKMENVYRQYPLSELFETVVTSNDVERGKPFPDAYILATERLQVTPEQCLVFEDSFAGIEAAQAAGMKVCALATTNPREELLRYTPMVMDSFEGFDWKSVLV